MDHPANLDHEYYKFTGWHVVPSKAQTSFQRSQMVFQVKDDFSFKEVSLTICSPELMQLFLLYPKKLPSLSRFLEKLNFYFKYENKNLSLGEQN